MGTVDVFFMKLGGARRDRTADLLHAMQALSQLSYSPMEGGTLRTAEEAVKDGSKRELSSIKTIACKT